MEYPGEELARSHGYTIQMHSAADSNGVVRKVLYINMDKHIHLEVKVLPDGSTQYQLSKSFGASLECTTPWFTMPNSIFKEMERRLQNIIEIKE